MYFAFPFPFHIPQHITLVSPDCLALSSDHQNQFVTEILAFVQSEVIPSVVSDLCDLGILSGYHLSTALHLKEV
jgi:hypothetical protein